MRVPVTVGLVRPVILLPADWSRWSTALLSSVVAHEQAHVDRRDHLVLLASELNRCLYWFHPVAWFLRHRLSTLAEQCCDDAVIAAMHSRRDYARHLLEISSRLTNSPRRYVPLAISMVRSSRSSRGSRRFSMSTGHCPEGLAVAGWLWRPLSDRLCCWQPACRR